MSRFIIYGLVDPRTLLVRYVGLSSKGLTRPRSYMSDRLLKERNKRSSWVRSLIDEGLTYEIAVLEDVGSKIGLAEAERWWVAYGRACGWPLTNMTDGGEGRIGSIPDLSTRWKMASAHAALWLLEGHRSRMRVARSQPRVISAETRRKIGDKHRGKIVSAETRRKLSEARRIVWAKKKGLKP